MRILSAFALSFAFAACGGSDKAKNDLSVSQDLTSGKGCFALIECEQGCSGVPACEQACVTQGTTNGQALFNALFACAYGICTQPGDSGTAACSSSTDLSSGCQACVSNAAQTAACSSQLGACEADTQGA